MAQGLRAQAALARRPKFNPEQQYGGSQSSASSFQGT